MQRKEPIAAAVGAGCLRRTERELVGMSASRACPDSRSPRSLAVASAGTLALLLGLASAGPYLYGGVRSEQVLLYAAVLWLGIRGQLTIRGPALAILALMGGLFVGVTAATALAPTGIVSSTGYVVSRSVLAGVDDLALAAASIAIGAALGHSRASAESALAGLYRGVLVFCSLNLLLQLAQAAGQGSAVFEVYNRGVLESGVVRYHLDEFGRQVFDWDRFPGVFIQPYEGGLFYGVALVLWAFRWGLHSRSLQLLGGLVLFVGSVLMGSKVVLAAVAVILLAAAVRWKSLPLGRAVLVAVGLAAAAAFYGGSRGLITSPLQGIGEGGLAPLAVVTGGRFGTGLAFDWAREMVRWSPIGGYGFAGYALPSDTLLLSWLSSGGAFGVACWLAILVVTGFAAAKWRGEQHNAGIAVLAFAVLAGIGGPALTANRSSTLLWVVISLSSLASWRWLGSGSKALSDRGATPTRGGGRGRLKKSDPLHGNPLRWN